MRKEHDRKSYIRDIKNNIESLYHFVEQIRSTHLNKEVSRIFRSLDKLWKSQFRTE